MFHKHIYDIIKRERWYDRGGLLRLQKYCTIVERLSEGKLWWTNFYTYTYSKMQ